MVITGLTRNQLGSNPPRVRISPSPPKNPSRKTWIFYPLRSDGISSPKVYIISRRLHKSLRNDDMHGFDVILSQGSSYRHRTRFLAFTIDMAINICRCFHITVFRHLEFYGGMLYNIRYNFLILRSENMSDNKEMLGTAPIGRLLFKLAVPTVVAQLINMLYNIVDRIYIGHIKDIGSLALTGVGVCMPIIMIISAFAALIASGGAPKASICMGKGDNDSAEKIMGGCFSLQLIISAVLTAVLLIWNKDLLLMFGASKNTIGYATDYMNIYAIGTVFVQLTLGMGAFITAQGYTKISMITVLIGAVSNIILDPIFIFGFKMGVKGAALATILSQAISCVWVLTFLCGKRTYLKLKRHNFRIDGKLVLPCIALGTATFIMQSSESVISVCFNSSLLKYGGDIAVGAMTILTSVMQ